MKTHSPVLVAALAIIAAAQLTLLVGAPDAADVKVPRGVKFLPDLSYREGNAAWKLDLAMPAEPASAPRPGLVFIHGGGWARGDKRDRYFLDGPLEYARRGYVCITINYRLSGEAAFPAAVEDVRCAVRWLRANAGKYQLDPERIGGFGSSAGAHLVAMLALAGPNPALDGDAPYREYSSGLQAACVSATPTDLEQFSGAGLNRVREFLEGPAATLAMRSRLASPVTHVRADAPPLLMIHGDADRTVDSDQSKRLYAALKKAGAKDLTLVMIHDGDHLAFRKHTTVTHPAMEAFFARTLKGIGQ